ncbi:MAG TPA: hypothetical protein VN174_03205 [Candidatus Methanoperedens sp.]|nr:hypothetical protein [Candidatus Methanoperedens sp.]
MDTVSKQAYVIYFGRISQKRINELLVEIAKNGVDGRSVVDVSYLPEFLARENLKIE